jgi:hypothetical protein
VTDSRSLRPEPAPPKIPEAQNEPRDNPSHDVSTNSHSPSASSHKLFVATWVIANCLLVTTLFFAIYSVAWEYSTQRYLTGFSDAIVPQTAPNDEKIEAILAWMAHGPARNPHGPSGLSSDRDPTDTLNYDALLRVCGTATNAFVNLADTAHLDVRRLLLLDEHQRAKHVVAEVLVDGRWIIVDPAYRVVLRDGDGKTVTRQDLLNPTKFADVTKRIPQYVPTYTFEHTVHIRVAGLPTFGAPLRLILDRLIPGWENSTVVTLLVERESFAAEIVALLLLIFALLLRALVRLYGERRLGIHSGHVREKLRRASVAFLNAEHRHHAP